MFTRNSIVLSNNIKTPLTALSKAVGNTMYTSVEYLARLIKSLFANNEQGFAYDPNDLTTLYQDAAGTIPVTAAGQPVGLMKDKSGRNNHVFQTVSASRPILQRNATTGAYYLAFDGSDDFLVTNSIDFTATDKVSLFTGVRKLSDAAPSVLVELSASIANVGTFNIQAPRTGNSYGVGVRGSTLNAVDYSTYTSPISNVISLKLTTSATNYLGAIMGRFDGVNTAGSANSSAASIGNYGNYPLYIGRRGGTSPPFNGHLYGLIGIGRLTTDSETAALEKVIAKNTGVTLNV